jgi:glycosyltransferase involved in cell wall biosynthesis
VLLQGYPNLEYFIIDGCSADNTVEIIKKYEKWINFWMSKPDRGQAHAINKGWQHASGDVLAWLNSDDILFTGAISKAINYFLENFDVGMVYGEAQYISEEGRIIGRFPTESFDPQRLVEVCYICQPATFIRRSVLDSVGFLSEALNFCMDYELWIRISRKHLIGHIPEYLALSRLHSECKTMSQRLAALKETVDMLHRYYGFVPPSWLGAYVRAVLERHLDRSIPWQNLLFMVGVIGLGSREFIRYNYHLPMSEFGRWRKGLRDGVKKMFRQRSNFHFGEKV